MNFYWPQLARRYKTTNTTAKQIQIWDKESGNGSGISDMQYGTEVMEFGMRGQYNTTKY